MTLSRLMFSKPAMLVIGWGLLVCAYVWSLQRGVYLKSWDHLIFLIQLVCDLTIGIMGFLAYRLREDIIDRKFYLLFFISIIPGLFANEIYNILINIIDISRTMDVSMYWSSGYFVFLVIQFAAWAYLLKNKILNQCSVNRRWLSVYPYIQSALIIGLSLVFIISIRYGTPEYIGNFRMVNSVLEILVFTLMALCLSRTNNSSLIYLETGFSLLIGFNFAHRFSDMLSIYYKAFNVVWLLCLIIIAYGLIAAVYDRKDRIQFYPENSIHVLTSGAFILFANLILMIFVIAAFGMSMLQIDRIPHISMLALDIPSALVFSYCLTVLLAKYLAYRLLRPLDDLAQRVDRIAENHGHVQADDNHFQIYELQKTEKFLINTISDLQHANQVKSEFLMNMSHDFRTPASGIQYMSRLIHDRMPDTELKRLQKMVVDSSEQLMILLEDVLDYSRLENDKLKLQPQQFNIANLIDELISAMSAKAQERDLTVTSQFEREAMMYYGDQAVIKRIILNLLSNAIKFTHAGYVSLSAVTENRAGNNSLVISIKDTGIGIDPLNHAAIFEPFYRVSSADSAKYPGIGLGLSNVKLMLSKIGGEISLRSEIGVGSEFTITLPIGDFSC